MAFVLDKSLEPDGEGFVIRFTKDEIASMEVDAERPVQVHITAPLDLERIASDQ